MANITLTIDGAAVEVEEGKTVLEAAQGAGINIPTMCAHPDLPPYGACRLCIVEIEGVRGFPTSCTTPAANNMKVKTKSPELEKLRNRTLELMLSGHPNACLTCIHRELCEKYRPRPTKAGKTTRCAFCSNRDQCTLRQMALETPARELNLPSLYSTHNLERDDPFIDRDYNLCILCGRCWRICEKIHGTPAISIINRGRFARIGTSFHKAYTQSGCTFCGACVDICPTGTLNDRFARWYGLAQHEVPSACTLCPEGCSLINQVNGGEVIANRMPAFTREARLCALGRFAYPQIMNAPDRLRRCMVRETADQIAADYGDVIAAAAKKLEGFRDGSFLAIMSESETRETRYLVKRLAIEVMKGRVAVVPAGGGLDDLQPESARKDLLAGKVKAALTDGDYLDEKTISGLEYLIVSDCLPSAAAAGADAVLPAAVLAEADGSFRTWEGEVKMVNSAVGPPGDCRPGWMIARDLAKALGASGFDYSSAKEIKPLVRDDPAPAAWRGKPRDTVKDLPARYRGHYIADSACALSNLGMPAGPAGPEVVSDEGFLVTKKYEIVPNFHYLEIEAPAVAKHAKPGQFAILMVKETSERAPFTLVDWDAEKGTVALVVEEVGRSSREIAALQAGQRVAHVSGPLGLPHPIEKVGTVVLGGGCYGIGGIYPIARALKEAGNRVISVIEASNSNLFWYEDKLKAVSDELLIASKDGSRGTRGGVGEVFIDLVKRGVKVDQFIAIGCTFMMKLVSDQTRELNVPTYVALNPIMVDGTGMCGACRVSVAGKTKFACVDGPMFNGHEIAWDELFSRRGAYMRLEVDALPQINVPLTVERHEGCSGTCGR